MMGPDVEAIEFHGFQPRPNEANHLFYMDNSVTRQVSIMISSLPFIDVIASLNGLRLLEIPY
jgi:hypothetical protein